MGTSIVSCRFSQQNQSNDHCVGLGPIFDGKNHGFRLRFSQQNQSNDGGESPCFLHRLPRSSSWISGALADRIDPGPISEPGREATSVDPLLIGKP